MPTRGHEYQPKLRSASVTAYESNAEAFGVGDCSVLNTLEARTTLTAVNEVLHLVAQAAHLRSSHVTVGALMGQIEAVLTNFRPRHERTTESLKQGVSFLQSAGLARTTLFQSSETADHSRTSEFAARRTPQCYGLSTSNIALDADRLQAKSCGVGDCLVPSGLVHDATAVMIA